MCGHIFITIFLLYLPALFILAPKHSSGAFSYLISSALKSVVNPEGRTDLPLAPNIDEALKCYHPPFNKSNPWVPLKKKNLKDTGLNQISNSIWFNTQCQDVRCKLPSLLSRGKSNRGKQEQVKTPPGCNPAAWQSQGWWLLPTQLLKTFTPLVDKAVKGYRHPIGNRWLRQPNAEKFKSAAEKVCWKYYLQRSHCGTRNREKIWRLRVGRALNLSAQHLEAAAKSKQFAMYK